MNDVKETVSIVMTNAPKRKPVVKRRTLVCAVFAPIVWPLNSVNTLTLSWKLAWISAAKAIMARELIIVYFLAYLLLHYTISVVAWSKKQGICHIFEIVSFVV